MSLRIKTLNRPMKTMAALGLATAALLAAPGMGGSAQAAPSTTVLSEGFEFPTTAWSFTQSGLGFGFIDGAAAEAHSGTKSALVQMFEPGFSSVGRNVNLPSSASTCTASAWIAPRFSANRQINFEVIDPATNQYIALKSVMSQGATGYKFHTVNWNKARNNVTLRFSVIGSDEGRTRARVDDVTVTCA